MAQERIRFPSKFPVLDAGEYTLRAIEGRDLPAMRAYLADPAVIERTSSDLPTPHEVDGLVQFYSVAFARRSDFRWAIVPKGEDAMVGSCGLSAFSERHLRGELGYELAQAAWGKGVATVVARHVIEYGFTELGLHRIEATVMTGNERSERVLEKLGFSREGVLREYKFARGLYKDYTLFSVLQSDWASGAGQAPL